MALDTDRTGISDIISILRPDSFYRQDHRLIFEALLSLFEADKPVDLVLLRDELKSHGHLDQVGGVDYLVSLVESVPSAANALYYARIVRDKAVLRNLITVTNEISNRAYDERGDVSETLETAEQKIFEVTQEKITGHSVTMHEVMTKVFELVEQRDGSITGLPTGFLELDEQLSGLQPGEMIVVAARPSMGKTALGLNVAEHVGANNKQPVAVFSLEMSATMLAERMLAGRSHVDSHMLRRGMLSEHDYQQLSMTAGELGEAKIYIDDSATLSPLELRAKARRLKMEYDIELVVVDYLQLMHASGIDSRQQEVGFISRQLKALARELNIPVLVMAQLNRGPEGREDHRPRMSDLRESGNIEQDADVIILLHRESYYKSKAAFNEDGRAEGGFESGGSSASDNIAELIVAKQRNGPTGTVKLSWLPQWTRFENLAHVPDPFGG